MELIYLLVGKFKNQKPDHQNSIIDDAAPE
jgi:hypothetical protein